MESNFFPSKILLIGEYSILYKSMGLALPFDKKFGIWQQGADNFDYDLSGFLTYLGTKVEITSTLDLAKLMVDERAGWSLSTNIPLGYGLGSSGVLCASIFKTYQRKDFDISKTREILILMENYFHGQSSGLDPLISYFNTPIVLQEKVQLLDKTYMLQVKNYNLFIVDSMLVRNTKSCVERFKENMQVPSFRQVMYEEIIPLNNALVHNYIGNETYQFAQNWKKLSRLSFDFYKGWIPEHIQDTWSKGLSSNQYFMKLCGAGAGGYFLVLAEGDTDMIKYKLEIG